MGYEILDGNLKDIVSKYSQELESISESTKVDEELISRLEEEKKQLEQQLESEKEASKFARLNLERAQEDMQNRNMGVIEGDTYFENNSKALEETENKVSETEKQIDAKNKEIEDAKNPEIAQDKKNDLESLYEQANAILNVQITTLEQAKNECETSLHFFITETENGYLTEANLNVNKSCVKELRKKSKEINQKLDNYKKLLANLLTVDKCMTVNKKELNECLENLKDYTEPKVKKQSIKMDISYNKETGKYTVTLKSGKYEFKSGREYTKEELTKETINKLLKGFAGAIAENCVSLSQDGKKIGEVDFKKAAEEAVKVADGLAKMEEETLNNNIEELDKKQDEKQEKEELKDEKTESVIQRVVKSRNHDKKMGIGLGTLGTAIGVGTTIAAGPLLGIPMGLGIVTIGNAKNIAVQYKTRKTRKKLAKIAKKAGLKVQVDRETGSVFFCVDGLDTRITSNNELETLKAQGFIPENFDLIGELDAAFNNAERGTATEEEWEIYKNNPKAETPLKFCQKVTLDNLEAAYQQFGGVYSRNEMSTYLKQLDPKKIAEKFVSTIKPEEKTEVEEATPEEALLEEEKVEEVKIETEQPVVEEPVEEIPDVETIEPTPVQPEPEEKVESDFDNIAVVDEIPEKNVQVDVEDITNADDLVDLLKELEEKGTVADVLVGEMQQMDDLTNTESKGMGR